VRHFPIASRRPRSPALHAAAEAVSAQNPDAFWWFVDSIYADLGHQDDPHLWQRVNERGLDLARFELDRRSDEVTARIRVDFESGIRAGVTGTPALFTPGPSL
jgi:protein-disulfide isomerase